MYYCNLCAYKAGSQCDGMRHVRSNHEGVGPYQCRGDQYKYRNYAEQKYLKLDTCVT